MSGRCLVKRSGPQAFACPVTARRWTRRMAECWPRCPTCLRLSGSGRIGYTRSRTRWRWTTTPSTTPLGWPRRPGPGQIQPGRSPSTHLVFASTGLADPYIRTAGSCPTKRRARGAGAGRGRRQRRPRRARAAHRRACSFRPTAESLPKQAPARKFLWVRRAVAPSRRTVRRTCASASTVTRRRPLRMAARTRWSAAWSARRRRTARRTCATRKIARGRLSTKSRRAPSPTVCRIGSTTMAAVPRDR
mmetsp:Transcript_113929/g.327389  ORF Transcript_113929/g.327389 Transcript_113929/m.327389 type:complete len:247 (-) Transcript_113929:213-953(-)